MFNFLKPVTECENKEVSADLWRFAVVQPPPFAAQLLEVERVFVFAFPQRAGADGGWRWPTTVPPADRDANRAVAASELRRHRRWPPVPPLRRDGALIAHIARASASLRSSIAIASATTTGQELIGRRQGRCRDSSAGNCLFF